MLTLKPMAPGAELGRALVLPASLSLAGGYKDTHTHFMSLPSRHPCLFQPECPGIKGCVYVLEGPFAGPHTQSGLGGTKTSICFYDSDTSSRRREGDGGGGRASQEPLGAEL